MKPARRLAVTLMLVLAGCAPPAGPNQPLTPAAEREIRRYAPYEDLSGLTMKDYAAIKAMIYSNEGFWRKRFDIRAYIRANR